MGSVMAGFDVHRTQITFDALDAATGEVVRGRIDATSEAVADWVDRFPGREVHVALEACTGWFFVSEALKGDRRGASSGRSRGDEGSAWCEAAGQDRSRGCALAAHAVA